MRDALGDDAGRRRRRGRIALHSLLLFLERDRICDPRVVRTCVSSRALARECHIAQTRKPLKNARETALFDARAPARRGIARFGSRTHTLARASRPSSVSRTANSLRRFRQTFALKFTSAGGGSKNCSPRSASEAMDARGNFTATNSRELQKVTSERRDG